MWTAICRPLRSPTSGKSADGHDQRSVSREYRFASRWQAALKTNAKIGENAPLQPVHRRRKRTNWRWRPPDPAMKRQWPVLYAACSPSLASWVGLGARCGTSLCSCDISIVDGPEASQRGEAGGPTNRRLLQRNPGQHPPFRLAGSRTDPMTPAAKEEFLAVYPDTVVAYDSLAQAHCEAVSSLARLKRNHSHERHGLESSL